MEHRRTPSPKAYVPASWFIVLTVMVCVGAAGWLGWLIVDGDGNDQASTAGPTATASTPPVTPSPTDTPTTPPPTTEQTPTIEPSSEPVQRTAQVSVLNNTTIRGLAATFSSKVRDTGWTVAGIGNWRGSIPGNTVYYPPDLQNQAEMLARDVDIDRVLPSVPPMRMDRLTIILSGPQQ